MIIKLTTDINIIPLSTIIMKEMNQGVAFASFEIAEVIEKDAKEIHRYNHRTYNLQAHTISMYAKEAAVHIVNSYIDDNHAHYGKYIHDGFSSWHTDPFIEDAIVRNWNKILAILDFYLEYELDKTLKVF